jgi:anti-sigma B factor antagonist
MQISQSQQGSWVLLTLVGPLDETGAAELDAALAPLINGGAVALDFSGVEYVTSSGFRVLMKACRQQLTNQGQFVLGRMSEPVRRFFEIAGLGTFFKIVPDLAPVLEGKA